MVEKTSVEEISYFTADTLPYNKTYGHWTVKWWQWLLSTPKSINPALDRTGVCTYSNHQSKDVCFLAGKLADEERILPNRYCRIPSSISILFPVINCEANPLEYPELSTPQELVERVKRDEDTIIRKECHVNGNIIPPQRVKSDPLVFELTLDEDNIFNIDGGGTTYASSDGYWVFLKPLPIGEYNIHFEGSCEYGKLNSGANYRLDVFSSVK